MVTFTLSPYVIRVREARTQDRYDLNGFRVTVIWRRCFISISKGSRTNTFKTKQSLIGQCACPS